MFCNPFSFKGRIRRTEYALSYIIFLISIYSVSYFSLELGNGGYNLILLFLACYWFLFSQGAKRCHDLGQSGYFQIIPFYVLVMVFGEGQKRTNIHGEDPKGIEFRTEEPKAIQRSTWKSTWEGKTLKLIANELLSASLVAVFIIEVLTLVLKNAAEFIYFIEILIVAGCYFLILLVSNSRKSLPRTSKYYVLHRAAYSVLLYVFLWCYEVLFINTTGINYAAWFGDVLYIISFFIVTYLPYLFYKRTRKSKILYAEV